MTTLEREHMNDLVSNCEHAIVKAKSINAGSNIHGIRRSTRELECATDSFKMKRDIVLAGDSHVYQRWHKYLEEKLMILRGQLYTGENKLVRDWSKEA